MSKPRLGKRERAAKRAAFEAKALRELQNKAKVSEANRLIRTLGYATYAKLSGSSNPSRSLHHVALKSHAHTPGCNSYGRGMGSGDKVRPKVPNGSKRFQKQDHQTALEASQNALDARRRAFEAQLRKDGGSQFRAALDDE